MDRSSQCLDLKSSGQETGEDKCPVFSSIILLFMSLCINKAKWAHFWTDGQAKTLMFVHINPDMESFGETISTLKFAERVSSVELGAACSNKVSGEVQNLRDQVPISCY